MLVLLLAASLSWSANRVGNGGHVVECADKRPQLLDFYEAGGMDFPAAVSGEDPVAILRGRLAHLKRVAPTLAEQYERRLGQIEKDWEVKSGVALKNVDDSLHAEVPADCKLKQAAIRKGLAVEEKRFIVDKSVWSSMSPTGRAGLYAHEIVYEHFSKLGESDSRKARKLVGAMFGPAIETMPSGKFWLFIKDLKIPIYP